MIFLKQGNGHNDKHDYYGKCGWKEEMIFKNILLHCFGVEIRSSSHWLWGYEVVPMLKSEKHLEKTLKW